MLIVVRHGQTDANRNGLLQGRADLPLNATGREQALNVARYLQSSGAKRIVSSPLQRALSTATEIAEGLGLRVDVDDRLIELDYGDWDQRRLADVGPDEWAAWRADSGYSPPGGESLVSVSARARAFGDEVRKEAAEGVVIAVSHVSPIKALVAWALGAPDDVTWRMQLDVCAVSRIGIRNGVPALLTFNERAHGQ